MQGTIIVVDDNKGVLSAVKLLLKNNFERIITLTSPITLPAVLREENAQVVLLDMNFSSGLNTGNEGLYWLHEIKKMQPSLPVVLFTAYADIDLAVRGIKEGATDFIVKPWDNTRLVDTPVSRLPKQFQGKEKSGTPPGGIIHVLGRKQCHETVEDTDRKGSPNGCKHPDYRRKWYRKGNAGTRNPCPFRTMPTQYGDSRYGGCYRIFV